MCPDWAVCLSLAAAEAEVSRGDAGERPPTVKQQEPEEGPMERVIYLDHASTTPADPEVVAAMLPWYTEQFGNPSTVYSLGLTAAQAVQEARESIAQSHRRRARGDLLHQRRHRVRQLGHPGDSRCSAARRAAT